MVFVCASHHNPYRIIYDQPPAVVGSGQSFPCKHPVHHRPIFDDKAILEDNHPFGIWNDVRLVCDQNDGNPLLRIQCLEDTHDLHAGLAVEVPHPFIRQDDRRLIDQGSGNGDTLLLAP
jgi:hypothetical protein